MSTARILKTAEGRYLELVEMLYSVPTQPDAWQHFGDLLINTLDARSGKIILRNNAGPSVHTPWKTNFDEGYHQQFEDYYGARCPWSQGFVKDKKPGQFYSTYLEYPQKKWLESEVYRDWARYQEITHAAALVLEQIGSQQLLFSLQRTPGPGHFKQAEVSFLNRLVPHLERVMHLTRELQLSHARSEAVAEAASRNSLPFVLLDARGQIAYMTKGAEEAVREESALQVQGNRLRILSPGAYTVFQHALDKAKQSSMGQWDDAGATVRIQNETANLNLVISPLGRASIESAFTSKPTFVAVFIDRGNLRVKLSASTLATLYGYTPTESRIAELLVNGHATREIANMQGIKENTVRIHIKALLAKAEVNRQQELFRLLLLGPARLVVDH